MQTSYNEAQKSPGPFRTVGLGVNGSRMPNNPGGARKDLRTYPQAL